MADFQKKKLSILLWPSLPHIFLVLLTVFAIVSCLLLYNGMVSTRESLEALDQSQTVSPNTLAQLKRNHQREFILDLVFIVIFAGNG